MLDQVHIALSTLRKLKPKMAGLFGATYLPKVMKEGQKLQTEKEQGCYMGNHPRLNCKIRGGGRELEPSQEEFGNGKNLSQSGELCRRI